MSEQSEPKKKNHPPQQRPGILTPSTPRSHLLHTRQRSLIDDQTFDEHPDGSFDLDVETALDADLDTDLDTEPVDLPYVEESSSADEGQKVSSSLPHRGVLEHLSPAVKLRLTQVGHVLTYRQGATLNSVGDPCQGLGIILRGQVRVEWMDALGWEPIAMMAEGDILGALEWGESKIWEERITAHTPTSILFIPSHLLHSLISTYPDLQRQTARYAERHNLHTLLGVHPLFQGIADQDLMRLVDLASLRYVSAGKILFGPQMILALLFVVGRGEIELSIDDRVIQTLSRGELANLEFALGGAPQLLTARVTSEATLYVLPFDEVEIMLGQASRLHLLQRQAHLLRARALNE